MLLWIDACVREESRTRILTKELVKGLGQETVYVRLEDSKLPSLDQETLAARTGACAEGDFSLPVFDLARQFAAADVIVISVPYWDLSFPAVLKKYIEAICVTGLTFKYSPEGRPIGLCRAKRLYYVTTAGGPIINSSFAQGYIEALSRGMFGIPEFYSFAAENLDVRGNDVEALLQESLEEIRTHLAEHPL